MEGTLPRSVFLPAVGQVVHCPLQAGVIAPCEHAAARPGDSAAATSGRVRFDSPKAATRATRPHQAHAALQSCLDPASILFSGHLRTTDQPIITAQNTQPSDFAFIKPSSQLGRQCTAPAGKRFAAAGALHHPGASQDPSSAKTRHQPTGPPQPTTDHCPSVGR